jgi:signal transduction histidine kinase
MALKTGLFLSFRGRLILLWASFLILTTILVFVIDRQVQHRVKNDVNQQNAQVKDAINSGFQDFASAISLAQQSLDKESYLFQSPQEIPPNIEHIIVTDDKGLVKDSTLRDLVDQDTYMWLPAGSEGAVEKPGDPVESESKHGGALKTDYLPINTANKGLYWFIIVVQQGSIISKVDDASTLLAAKTQQWSNLQIAATTGVLLLAFALVVIVVGRFARPINELAAAARRVAGGDLDFSVKIDRLDEVGQLASTFNEMIADLKHKLELEEKLNQAERAAVVGRLTQGVAHEIRNPLNVINLSIDHVNKKFPPEDESKRKQFTGILSSIKDEILRLNKMVTDLLNFGRPAQLALGRIDIGDLVEETVALIRAQADLQGVSITVKRDTRVAQVNGDAERLKSCMSNITINALQAMPSGGNLTALVRGSNGFVEVSISDTGVGISEESLAKVFEPYFSTKQAGFGLGLAVTKKIVEEHQGRIDVTSRLNQGTTFTLRLPAADNNIKHNSERTETKDG